MKNILFRFHYMFTAYAGEERTRHNILNSIWDGAWYAVMTGLTASFMGVYALSLGASDTMLGWLSSLPALVALLSQIPAAVITERQPQRLKILVPFSLVFRSGYLLFAFIPFLPLTATVRAWLFVALVSLINFPGTVANVSWSAMMGDIFPTHLRGRIFSDRNMLLGIVTMLCTLSAGPLLDSIPYPYNFMTLFTVSFSALMVSTWFLLKIKEHPPAVTTTEPVVSRWSGIRQTLRDKNFLFFAIALFVVHLGFNISAAMWTILHVKVLLLTKTYIGIITVISQLVSVLTYRWWGRFSDKYGPKLALFLSIGLFMPQPWLHNFIVRPWPLIPLSILNGFAGAGFGMVLFNVLLDISPDENARPSYIAVFNTLMGFTGFVTPLVGVALYQSTNMATVFTLATLLRLGGMILMMWKLDIKIPSRRSRVAAGI